MKTQEQARRLLAQQRRQTQNRRAAMLGRSAQEIAAEQIRETL